MTLLQRIPHQSSDFLQNRRVITSVLPGACWQTVYYDQFFPYKSLTNMRYVWKVPELNFCKQYKSRHFLFNHGITWLQVWWGCVYNFSSFGRLYPELHLTVFVVPKIYSETILHVHPHYATRHSAARPCSKSCAMPQVYVDVASARLRHAVRCCTA